MNSYDENLHSTVVASLQGLELAQKSMKSKLDASIFTLYYTEGARITAGEKLDDANDRYLFQQKVKEQAVNNGNISINLLTAANQQKKYTAQSVTNTAVCAANVQVAANAIVRLAGDTASIYSILRAADFDTEIYQLGEDAYELMNTTAYNAEKVSQAAMDASTQTAEVSSSTVADEAKSTNEAIANLLKVTSADFDAISATVAADNAALALASAAEKKAEGKLEFINVEYFATNTAYQINKKELNQNLTVVPQNLDIIPEDKRNNESYVVSFDYYKSPFRPKELPTHHKGDDTSGELPEAGYPVNDYYIMLVKDSKKLTFSNSNAESLLLKGSSNRYLQVDGAPPHPRDEKTSQTIFIQQLLDSDGDSMELGQKYVVFVLTVFTEEYKKAINNFDDYLSAPSATFKLTNRLSSPKPDKNNIIIKDKHLVFNVEHNEELPVEYRCIFLPDNKDLIKGLLSEKGLRSIEQEVQKLETIADRYDPVIAQLEAELATLNSKYNGLKLESEGLTLQIKKTPKAEREKLREHLAKIHSDIQNTHKEISKTKSALKSNKSAQARAMKSLMPAKTVKPGFFFNLKLAEQVAAANYTVAHHHHADKHFAWHARIHENTTDNFGNRLIPGKRYVPVVLSASTALEENLDQYTNSLSAYAITESFTYES
jgi:hypothetical protein